MSYPPPGPGQTPPPIPPQQPPSRPHRKRRHRTRTIVLASVVGVVALIVVLGTTLGGGSKPGAPAASSSTPAASTSPAAATVTLSAGETQFATDLKNAIGKAGYATSESNAGFGGLGTSICNARTAGASQSMIVAKLQSANDNLGVSSTSVVRLAEQDICPSEVPVRQTVTYVVTGTSGAQVTYGPAGSDYNGYVPMRVTRKLATPSYYAINAQLQGGGTVACEILVDGKVLSSAMASGGYNIADCEISQDPISGQWQNDNTG